MVEIHSALASLAHLLAQADSAVVARGMDPLLKDVIDATAKLIGMLAVLFGGISLYLGVRTRREEMRWRKATTARDLLAEIHKHPLACEAVNMMDCRLGEHPYDAHHNELCRGVDWERVRAAVRSEGRGGQTDAFVATCFDWLLYYFDRLGYHVRQGFVIAEDIQGPLYPYAELILSHWTDFQEMVKDHHYDDLHPLLTTIAPGVASSAREASPAAAGAPARPSTTT